MTKEDTDHHEIDENAGHDKELHNENMITPKQIADFFINCWDKIDQRMKLNDMDKKEQTGV